LQISYCKNENPPASRSRRARAGFERSDRSGGVCATVSATVNGLDLAKAMPKPTTAAWLEREPAGS
jgi:hypothetical protein